QIMEGRKGGGVTRERIVAPRGAGLKVEFQSKLKGAAAGGAGDFAKAGAAKCCAGCGTSIRREEKLRRVGHSKSFQPQIEIQSLRKANGLGQCCVQVEEVGTAEIVAAHGTEGTRGRGSRETGRAEPRIAFPNAVKNF